MVQTDSTLCLAQLHLLAVAVEPVTETADPVVAVVVVVLQVT
jgi:hypothetical protein